MNILIWNVRGLNDPLKQKEVVGRVRDLKINLVSLIETKVKENKINAIISKHFHGWQVAHNYSKVAYNGRIWLLWNGLQVDLVDTMDQSITCCELFGMQRFFLSVIYGCNKGAERRRFWSHLLTMKASIPNGPWLLAGDFNVIAHHSESSKCIDSQSANLKEFQDCLQELAVFDHVYFGPMFTWSNHQDETFVAKKLDRVLISENWHLEFAHSTVVILPSEVSDHSPMLVKLNRDYSSSPKPFKFFNYWIKHSTYFAIVEKSWLEPMSGSPMAILYRKLKRLKQKLKAFNKENFSEISMKVETKRAELARVQEEILRHSRAELVQTEKKLAEEFHELK